MKQFVLFLSMIGIVLSVTPPATGSYKVVDNSICAVAVPLAVIDPDLLELLTYSIVFCQIQIVKGLNYIVTLQNPDDASTCILYFLRTLSRTYELNTSSDFPNNCLVVNLSSSSASGQNSTTETDPTQTVQDNPVDSSQSSQPSITQTSPSLPSSTAPPSSRLLGAKPSNS